MTIHEQNVLGCLMLDADSVWRVRDLITAADFVDLKNRYLYSHILERIDANMPVDAVTLADELEAHGNYAMQIAVATPTATNARHYAERVADDSIIRQVKVAGQKIARLDGRSALDEALGFLQAIQRRDVAAVRSAKEVLHDVVKELQAKCDADSAITGLDTGFEHLNEYTAGFQAGDLVVVAGRPSMGKTTFAQNIAERVALRGQRVLFFTQEMSGASVLTRSMASIGGVSFGALRSPKLLDDVAWSRALSAGEKLSQAPFLLDETCGVTIEQVCARARQCHASSPLSLIVIDYLSYMKFPKGETTALAIQEITRGLKSLAKTLGIPVVLVSQLNRGVESRADKRPNMSDLRESGAIEQDADVVIFMYRDDYYNRNSQKKGFAEAIIAKQRNGRTGTIMLRARLDQMRFEDCDEQFTESTANTVQFGPRTDAKARAAGD